MSLKDAVLALAEYWKQVPETLVKKSWCPLFSSKNMDEWDADSIPLRESRGELVQLVELMNR